MGGSCALRCCLLCVEHAASINFIKMADLMNNVLQVMKKVLLQEMKSLRADFLSVNEVLKVLVRKVEGISTQVVENLSENFVDLTPAIEEAQVDSKPRAKGLIIPEVKTGCWS